MKIGGGFLRTRSALIGPRIQCVPTEEAVAAKRSTGRRGADTGGPWVSLKFVRGIRGIQSGGSRD